MADFKSKILEQVTNIKGSNNNFSVSCVTVCHNEYQIIEQFLDHYRSIGCARFIIVDDNSDDGTCEILEEQKDVILFRPSNGARFRENVGTWRQELLDHFCDGQWVTLPDVDEFLYYKQMPSTLPELVNEMESLNKEALLAVMLDMYGDRPFYEQTYSGERPLIEEFPYFDGQGEPPSGVRIVAQPSSFVRRYPTPSVCFMGGVRDRMFFQKGKLSPTQRWLISRYANMKRPINPRGIAKLQNKIVRFATKDNFSEAPSVLNKFALLKWQKGTNFSRAPHSIDRAVMVSEDICAMLHFKFYKGISGFNYSRERAQHAGDSILSKKILDKDDILQQSPMCSNSKRFDGVASLSGVIR
ncbi:glycosyltransferase family 2 protein [Thioclava sp.]|uniref:glycosyltransferase family 2 protein n=1 Tax=Thioclava sp. TaxID=1933450 RepID=UPI003AA95DF3